MSAFARAASALLADQNLGVDAIYRPTTGADAACRAILARPIEPFADSTRGAVTAALDASVVTAPARGAALIIGAQSYKIESVTREESGAMFDLVLSRA